MSERASEPWVSAVPAARFPAAVSERAPGSVDPGPAASGATSVPSSETVEDVPESAATVFGDGLPLARRFADLLVTDGVRLGLIGPREPARIWSRHLFNCAALSAAIPGSASVVDVGSGAGLPGLVLAICRPDVRIRLVEPQQRRVAFLDVAVTVLGLGERVAVLRGRAEEPHVRAEAGGADVVTARAVAPLDRLVRWCLPLLGPSGRLALIKGSSASAELAGHAQAIRRAGGVNPRVVRYAVGAVEVPVVLVDRGRRGVR